MKKLISIIIRTLNEEKYLQELIDSLKSQEIIGYQLEIVVVDSGSTDNTLKIVKKNNLRLTHIDKKRFSFGRSLNVGCQFSKGSILVFISGHCVPTDSLWLANLVDSLKSCGYVYGRQVGRDSTIFSENQVFNRQYPTYVKIPQDGFFCNNANAAILREVWNKYQFDEDLTGCEDMDLAKRYFNDGGIIGYQPNSNVYHIHNESWKSIRNRYEREALALQKIMPEVHFSFFDFIMFFSVAVLKDFKEALLRGIFFIEFVNILRYRFEQYYGTYRGNSHTKRLSYQNKIDYFYPRVRKKKI